MKLHQPVTRCGVLGLDETLCVLVGLAEGRAGEAGLTPPPRPAPLPAVGADLLVWELSAKLVMFKWGNFLARSGLEGGLLVTLTWTTRWWRLLSSFLSSYPLRHIPWHC